MKLKLIVNGIINLFTATGFILFMIGFFKIYNKALDAADNPIDYVLKLLKGEGNLDEFLDSAYMALAGVITMAITWMVQIVLGIFIISTSKTVKENRWLAVFSGCLSLVGGGFGINAIVSFLGAFLIKERKRKVK